MTTLVLAAARSPAGLVATLVSVAAVGWLVAAHETSGMDDGPWTSLGAPRWFLGVWLAMMAAMMLPSVWPTVALYSRMSEARSALPPLLFTAGYLALGVMSLVWGALIAVVIATQKMLERRRVATYGTVALLGALGVLVLAAPGTLPGLTVPGASG